MPIDQHTTVPNWLARCAAQIPAQRAIRCGTAVRTYAELEHDARALALLLAAGGIRPGDRVALLARNGLPFVVVVHALMKLGAILVPLNARLTAAEIAWQIGDAGPALLLADAHHAEMAQAIEQLHPDLSCAPIDEAGRIPLASPPGHAFGRSHIDASQAQDTPLHETIDLGEPQAIIYTSGTTGRPKGAIITYGMQWWSAMGSMLNLEHRAGDSWLALLPFFHIGGLAILLRAVIAGTNIIVHDRFDPAAANGAIRHEGVTLVSVVAVMLQRMLDDLDVTGQDLPGLRYALLGGGPAPRPLLEAAARRSIPVLQTYGMTETCSQAVTLPPADALRKLGSAGLPLTPVQLQIWRDGVSAVPGAEGEIMLRGPTITSGYWGQPDATAASFKDGWFATGDIGRLDDEGYLTVLDRRADLIISGGENVYPAEIEAALLAHPAIADAGVRGIADLHWGQVPIAFVALRDGLSATPDELRTHLAARLAPYKLPRVIIFVAALPRNAAGKLLRRELPDGGTGDGATEDAE